MGVRKRHNRWWVDFSFGRVRYRKPSPENSKAGAQAYEAVLKQRLARGEPVEKPVAKKQLSFKEFAGNWFEVYVKNNNKHSEIRHKETTLRVHLLPFFGRMTMDGISSLDVEKYKSRKIMEGLNPKTINNHLTVLRKCLRTAVEWDVTAGCPTIKELNVPPQRFDFLSEEESKLLIASAQGVCRAMINVALETGLRFGEIKALTWEDVDFRNNEITVRQAFAEGVLGSTKNNRIRHIPMTESVLDTLSGLNKDSGFVFTDKSGIPMCQSTCVRRLHMVCKRAGIRYVGWHTLRHTFASHLAMSGANIVAIQHLLGHTEIHTTMRYAHINGNVLREAISILNRGNKALEHSCHNSVTGYEDSNPRTKLDIQLLANTN